MTALSVVRLGFLKGRVADEGVAMDRRAIKGL